MRRNLSLFIFGGFLLIALMAIGLSALQSLRTPSPWVSLSSRIPLEIDGWIGEDVPLGATESILEAVGRLNYSDYIYRIYRKGGREVSIYAMFWRQGDISVREMSGHTPDGCWVANGAKHCMKPEVRPLKLSDGLYTAPAEVREFLFTSSSQHIHAAWWHIWGGELVDRSFATKSPIPMLKEIWLWLFQRSGSPKDQLLVRIHSVLPVDEAIQTAPVFDFIQSIPEVTTARKMGLK